MSRIKVSENFYLDEFINDEIYKRFKGKSIWFLDIRVIAIAQLLRTLSGRSVTINNWYNGGQYKDSGLRRLSGGIGAKYSQHRYGRAIDVKVEGLTIAEVLDIIVDNEQAFRQAGLTTIEDIKYTPTWMHLDCRYSDSEDILYVRP